MAKKTVEEWRPYVQEVLESKTKEFHSLGYSRVTPDELWHCLIHNVWNGNPKLRLHAIVRDIFKLKTQVFMNYLTMKAYQDDDLLESIEALTQEESS
ncbi:MAG TPA: post-transcriptional regulator [Bacillota bacterium]|nr:post-transcriptional regulator [Bacillota bacterium]